MAKSTRKKRTPRRASRRAPRLNPGSPPHRSQDEGWARSLGNNGVQPEVDPDSNSTVSDIRYDRDMSEPRTRIRGK